ncbi:hypothetical protein GCM10025862_19770 [Arsenicicoccus piscis]|uniref:Uncharacterized protein n=1 Tax=Arsenicicoccus piscis TaxID=673954 RepID=A0ABQ6HNG2_9MICO|nr:hypothetical protein GCM10025862_19770 [Arsenicicoccus piscis]
MVNLVIRHDDLGRDMSRYLADRVEQSPRIKIWRCSEVSELIGHEALEEVVLHDLRTDAKQRVATTAMFVLIGATPYTSWLDGQIALDAKGFILTGPVADGSEGACSRPAARASSPWATYAVGRSSASPPPSAKARSRSARCTGSWKPRVAGEQEQTRRALSVMEQRELKTKVMRFVGEIGIAPRARCTPWPSTW